MSTPPQSRTPKTAEHSWTPRQREVLDLLVRGFTNGEIASKLNISLDGAKWHVSEIMSTLGVDTRAEAAEYWRHRNGLRMRFTRTMSAILGGPALKWAAAAAGLLATAVTAIAVIAILRDGGADQGAGGSATPPAATGTPSAQPGNAASPPSGSAHETIGGIDVQPLKVSSGARFPDDLLLYFGIGCYACDSGLPTLFRAYRDSTGALHIEDLLALSSGLPPETGAAIGANGEMFASSCKGDSDCVAVGLGAPPEAPQRLYRSTDGGISFSPWGDLPARSALVAVLPDEVIYSTWLGNDDQGPLYRYYSLPSGKEVVPPADAERSTAQFLPGLGLTWSGKQGDLLDASGSTLYKRQFPAATGPDRAVAAFGNQLFVQWGNPPQSGPPTAPVLLYLGHADARGRLQSIFSWDRQSLTVAQPLDASRLLVGALMDNGPQTGQRLFAYEAAIVDTANATITPLAQLSAGLSENSNPFPRAAVLGRFLRVTGAGDCLNVRESASTSAKSLGCFKDNVLLTDRGQSQEAGGIAWAAVRTPTGADGWATREFLR